jgi:hypothetical protein
MPRGRGCMSSWRVTWKRAPPTRRRSTRWPTTTDKARTRPNSASTFRRRPRSPRPPLPTMPRWPTTRGCCRCWMRRRHRPTHTCSGARCWSWLGAGPRRRRTTATRWFWPPRTPHLPRAQPALGILYRLRGDFPAARAWLEQVQRCGQRSATRPGWRRLGRLETQPLQTSRTVPAASLKDIGARRTA